MSLYSDFVKANIHKVPGKTQPERMRAVAKLWQQHKKKGGSGVQKNDAADSDIPDAVGSDQEGGCCDGSDESPQKGPVKGSGGKGKWRRGAKGGRRSKEIVSEAPSDGSGEAVLPRGGGEAVMVNGGGEAVFKRGGGNDYALFGNDELPALGPANQFGGGILSGVLGMMGLGMPDRDQEGGMLRPPPDTMKGEGFDDVMNAIGTAGRTISSFAPLAAMFI